MKRQTEEFLNLCLWSADILLRPTFRNLTASYEGWAYRNGLLPRLSLLEQKQLLERNPAEPRDRLYRLTAEGRLHALGGRDPQERWSRKWDGRWRLVLFDVPVTHNHDRKRLRRYLAQRGFGYLQNSVWITPDALDQEMKSLIGGKINVQSLIFMEARPCAGESDEEIVAGAWDFERINGLYSRLLQLLNQCDNATVRNTSGKSLLRWLALEREAWLAAISSDPLLPERILPANYLGKIAWSRRKEVLRETSRRWQNFKFRGHGAGQM
jgi:phenylacetic acid degradation operon negative regulatory protein